MPPMIVPIIPYKMVNSLLVCLIFPNPWCLCILCMYPYRYPILPQTKGVMVYGMIINFIVYKYRIIFMLNF